MTKMKERGRDNAFILYGYAIYLAATREDDYTMIKEYVYRAQVAEKRHQKRNQLFKSVYEIADKGFFRHAAIFQQSGETWHNYALCR